MDSRTLRIRLKFLDPRILTPQQIKQGLLQSWYLVRLEDVHTIDDVVSNVVVDFQLERSCPNGLGLEVDGFVLPGTQPAGLLRDSDLVRVKRQKDHQGLPDFQISNGIRNEHRELTNHCRFDGHCGVELRALDEFEKETGGYQSEEEEGDMETDTTLDGRIRMLPLCAREKDRGGKKRKRGKNVVYEQGKLRQTTGMESGPNLTITEVNERSVIPSGVSQPGGVNLHSFDEFEKESTKNEVEDQSEERAISQKVEKHTKAILSGSLGIHIKKDGAEKKQKKSKKMKVEGDVETSQLVLVETGLKEDLKAKKKKKNMLPNPNSEEKPVRVTKVKKKMVAGKVGKSKEVTEVESPAETFRTPEPKMNGGSKGCSTSKDGMERPSRSARRKKAKRLWLREQAKKALIPHVDSQPSGITGSEERLCHVGTGSLSIVEKNIEAESEEEMVPIVLRAGHIRFEPYETDETQDMNRPSLPVLNLGDQPKSKRKGQSWGQEKGENQKGRKWRQEIRDNQTPGMNADARVNSIHEHQNAMVNFEELPALEGVPQKGDVLAYRIVELTSSWTPEISPYRVGVVSDTEQGTNMIRLDPHPDYPSQRKEDDLANDDLSMVPEEDSAVPQDECESLEVELSALLEVRLLHRELSGNQVASQAPSLEITEGLQPTIKCDESHHSGAETTSKTTVMAPSAMEIDGADVVSESAPAWQALVSKELELKKMELAHKGVELITSVSQGTVTQSGLAGGNQGSIEVGEQATQPRTSSRVKKSKYLKSAGVGSIVTLLRAQQVL